MSEKSREMHLWIWNAWQSKNVHKSVGSRSSLEPPLRQTHFIFIESFPKNQEKIINNQVKLTNRPPFKKSWIRHYKSKCTQVKPTQIDQNHPIYIKKYVIQTSKIKCSHFVVVKYTET